MIFLDFEFNQTKECQVGLVCASCFDSKTNETNSFWLHDVPHRPLIDYLNNRLSETFIAYAAQAEARCLYQLGINPTRLKIIDLFLEYRCLSNKNDKLNYGKQYRDGQVINTKKPKPFWEKSLKDEKTATDGFKPSHSLAEASYKLLGIEIDTDRKEKLRELIISNPFYFTEFEQEEIIKYCESDIQYLPQLFNKMVQIYKSILSLDDFKLLQKEMIYRGKYASLAAIRETHGHPVNVVKMKTFAKNVPLVIKQCQIDINSQFNDPLNFPFKYNKRHDTYTWNQVKTREWIASTPFSDKWEKTETGNYSLSLDAFLTHYNFSHDYPRENFGAQMVRYLKLKQSLNGFTPAKKSRTIFDSLGTDNMLRPYQNIYGSQTSRSQPPSTSFLLLKPAWQRSLLEPPKDYLITSVDYSSQEYLVSALFYNDEKMIDAYRSGDVYLAFAKQVGLVPKNGTKEEYKYERNICKSTVLGLSFGMTSIGLAAKLSSDTGKEFTEQKAQELIDLFEENYSDWKRGQFLTLKKYYENKYLKLKDGWILFGDQDNKRSTLNFSIQGAGAAIMRSADLKCYDSKLKIILTLHDALYMLHHKDDLAAIDTLIKNMKSAFVEYFPENKKDAQLIRLEPFTWGQDIDSETLTTPNGLEVDCAKLYIDERAVSEYENFKIFFEDEYQI